MNIDNELVCIKEQIERLQKKFPDFQIYITASKEFNEQLTKHLGTEDYSIRLEELFGQKYQVSPFMDKYNWVV